jgi:hypothetical protein
VRSAFRTWTHKKGCLAVAWQPFETQFNLSADDHRRSAQQKVLAMTCEEPRTLKVPTEPNNVVNYHRQRSEQGGKQVEQPYFEAWKE